MNLLLDENVDQPIALRLRQDGHTVIAIVELEPSIDDHTVLARANSLNSLLVTADKDFGELVFRQRTISGGVLLLRLAGLKPHAKADIVSRIIREHGDDLSGMFTVVSPSNIRIRQGL